MSGLRLINTPKKSDMYWNALQRSIEKSISAGEVIPLKQWVFYGVKYVSLHPERGKSGITQEEAASYFTRIDLINSLMAQLTPNQFVNIFPITKNYEGAKYGEKDYFYTIQELKKYDMDAPIGDKIDEFLWDYHNWDICNFVVEMISAASTLRQLHGEKGIFEEWAEQNGLKAHTPLYQKPNPDYLKLIKPDPC